MKDRDPRRLLDGGVADARLHSLLQAGADEVAPADALERSARKLSAALGAQLVQGPHHLAAPNPAPAVTHGAGAAHAALGGKLLVASAAKGALVLAVVGAASFMAIKGAKHAAAPHAQAAHAAQALAHVKPQPTQASPAIAPAPTTLEPATNPLALPTPARAAREAAPAATAHASLPVSRQAPRAEPQALRLASSGTADATRAPQPSEPDAPTQESSRSKIDNSTRAAELHSLEAAQSVLGVDPQLALQRLRAHARAFPDGWLDEERGALEVQALLQLGARTEAARALDQLAARHPHSLAISRLRNALR